MEEIRLKRDNLHHLASALELLLGDAPFNFSYQSMRKNGNNGSSGKKEFEQCVLFGDNSICSWVVGQDESHRKSTIKIAVKLPSGKTKFLFIHPSVRCGGRRYPDCGHSSWFTVEPHKITIHDGHNISRFEFQPSC